MNNQKKEQIKKHLFTDDVEPENVLPNFDDLKKKFGMAAENN